MAIPLKEQLLADLRLAGHADIATAVEQGLASTLPSVKKDILFAAATRVKNGDGRVFYNHGMAGPSAPSGSGGIWSGGWGTPEGDAEAHGGEDR